jgi:hypothetical protein
VANEVMFTFTGLANAKTTQALVEKYKSASHGHDVSDVFNASFMTAIDAMQQGYGDSVACALAGVMQGFVNELEASITERGGLLMKVKCECCEEEFDCVPSLDEIQDEIKEKLLDRMEFASEAEMAAYIDELHKRIVGAVRDAANQTLSDLEHMRLAAAEKFAKKP